MKRLLFALFLLVCAWPVFASDEEGYPGYIPNYQELVREGYGPRDTTVTRIDYYNPAFIRAMAKPTQAYYGKGFTIYFGFEEVPIWQRNQFSTYAFGYPLEYFQHLMPQGVASTNLNHYALEVRKNTFQPGTYVAQQPAAHPAAVTTVQSVTTNRTTATPSNGATTLPAVGEKPSH